MPLESAGQGANVEPSNQTNPLARDADEVARLIQGDRSILHEVGQWARQIVRARVYRLSREEEDDLVQETVAQVWSAAGRDAFALRVGLKPFVRKVAAARAVDRLRRRRPNAELDPNLCDRVPDPYENALRRDEEARLAWALQSLDDPCRQLIRAHYFEDRSYESLAAEEGRAVSTLRVRLFHCMQALRKLAARWA